MITAVYTSHAKTAIRHFQEITFTVFIQHTVIKQINRLTPINALVLKLYVQSFTWFLHVSTLFSRHPQEADNVPVWRLYTQYKDGINLHQERADVCMQRIITSDRRIILTIIKRKKMRFLPTYYVYILFF
jgi:hypothetical protein